MKTFIHLVLMTTLALFAVSGFADLKDPKEEKRDHLTNGNEHMAIVTPLSSPKFVALMHEVSSDNNKELSLLGEELNKLKEEKAELEGKELEERKEGAKELNKKIDGQLTILDEDKELLTKIQKAVEYKVMEAELRSSQHRKITEDNKKFEETLKSLQEQFDAKKEEFLALKEEVAELEKEETKEDVVVLNDEPKKRSTDEEDDRCLECEQKSELKKLAEEQEKLARDILSVSETMLTFEMFMRRSLYSGLNDFGHMNYYTPSLPAFGQNYAINNSSALNLMFPYPLIDQYHDALYNYGIFNFPTYENSRAGRSPALDRSQSVFGEHSLMDSGIGNNGLYGPAPESIPFVPNFSRGQMAPQVMDLNRFQYAPAPSYAIPVQPTNPAMIPGMNAPAAVNVPPMYQSIPI